MEIYLKGETRIIYCEAFNREDLNKKIELGHRCTS